MKFTNDGDAEAAVQKVDFSTLSGARSRLRIDKVWASVGIVPLEILWDATVDVQALVLAPGMHTFDFRCFGGIPNNAGAGVTQDINFTCAVTCEYTIILHMSKF
jgi:hypothetical protein